LQIELIGYQSQCGSTARLKVESGVSIGNDKF